MASGFLSLAEMTLACSTRHATTKKNGRPAHRFECSLKQIVAAGSVRRNQEENFIPFSGAGNKSAILPKFVLPEYPLARLFCVFRFFAPE